MYTKKVRVLFEGKLHTVEVGCNPSTPLIEVEKAAIRQLRAKKQKQQEAKKHQLVFWQGVPIEVI